MTRYFHGNLPRNINIRSIRSAGTAEAIGISGINILDIISKKPHSTLNMFHISQRFSKEFTKNHKEFTRWFTKNHEKYSLLILCEFFTKY